MMAADTIHKMIIFGFIFPFYAIDSLKILHSSIPQMIDATNLSSSTAITLDCSYSYDSGDIKLVIRWFHNDSPEPVYQWIPESNIRYVSELIRPYFDHNFTINNDNYSKYRALRLNLLQLQQQRLLQIQLLSGNYTCVISSIANQDSRQIQLIIYVPPRLFEFHFIELSANHIALECLIENVYPEPQMLLLFSKQNHHSNYLELLSSSINITHNENCNNKMTDDSCQSLLYNASIQHSIDSILTAGTIYECRIKLRGTYYVRKKRIKIIFPTNYDDDRMKSTNLIRMSNGDNNNNRLSLLFLHFK
uniref:Uncharacterized protein LOC113796306 n=1 Tax=Dermatophagoides pteronyssinus TaxID=6956 RepID=A0A6P6YA58_DERPT